MGWDKLIKAICQFLNCDESLKHKLGECEAESGQYKEELKEALGGKALAEKRLIENQGLLKKCISTRRELKEQVSDLIKKMEDMIVPKEDPQETYWNSKYPKKKIFYRRQEHDGQYDIDVRTYFQPYDALLEKIVKGNKLNIGTSDEKALKCLKWVRSNIKYISDKAEYGFDEFWAYHYQTITHGRDDCEGGAIVLANLMLVAGIPYWRIRLNAGMVKGGGHCYATYCRETDNQFVTLDWCYWYNDAPVEKRKLHKDERDYYGIWFSWNQKYSFGEMETMASIEDKHIRIT